MSLNNKQLQKQRVVVARSVVVDEVAEAYERLHVTVSLGILHGSTDQFRFVVPAGFEITTVATPLLARWEVKEIEKQRVLDVRLRESTTETVVLNVAALRVGPPPEAWTLATLQPLEVAGQVVQVREHTAHFFGILPYALLLLCPLLHLFMHQGHGDHANHADHITDGDKK